MGRRAVAIRHVPFEDAGIFEDVLAEAGYTLTYREAGLDSLADAASADLLLVLGGPLGANDLDLYPFLANEIALIAERLHRRRPLFGICLGAQLMARALGAPVAPMGCKEIGFSPLTLTEAGRETALRHLNVVPVLHWHGDRFAMPEGAQSLARTGTCDNQAFAPGPNAMGLQFHPEVRTGRIERWLIGHAAELWGARIDPRILRQDALTHGAALERAGRAFFAQWLGELR